MPTLTVPSVRHLQAGPVGDSRPQNWGGSWEKVHNVKIFKFCFFTDSYGGFNEEASIENRLKKY